MHPDVNPKTPRSYRAANAAFDRDCLVKRLDDDLAAAIAADSKVPHRLTAPAHIFIWPDKDMGNAGGILDPKVWNKSHDYIVATGSFGVWSASAGARVCAHTNTMPKMITPTPLCRVITGHTTIAGAFFICHAANIGAAYKSALVVLLLACSLL